MKLDFQKIKNAKWYRQQTSAAMYFVMGPGMGAEKVLNGSDDVLFYFSRNDFRGYYNEEFFKKLSFQEFTKIKNNPARLKKLYKNWSKGNQMLLQQIKHIQGLNINSLSNTGIISLNKHLGTLAKKYWERPIFLDIFDLHAQELVINELKKYSINILPENLTALLSSIELSFSQKYHLALYKLSKKIYSKEKIFSEFFYIKCSYAVGKGLTESNIKHDLKNLKKSEFNFLKNYSKIQTAKKLKLFEKYKLRGWPKRMLESFAFLTKWREERKMVLQKTVFALNILGKQIAKRSNLPWEKIAICLPYKIDKIPVPKKTIQFYQNQAKNNFFGVYDKQKQKTVFLNSADSKKLLNILEPKNQQKSLSGQIACQGKITGIAKLIAGEADFKKFKKGDILVTSMTRPEFMPLLRLAKGIITDEGGITCHAAIVSRELNVPCVIGTRHATRVIKSGDKIELDATNGIVKILNPKS